MQDQAQGGSQEDSVGQIRDQRVQQPQGRCFRGGAYMSDRRTAVQTRTFTRWMNMFLQRRDPPVVVLDLLADLQDGRILLVLLEELSGCKLLNRFRSSSHRIFRLNNISQVLSFLDDRHVKLLGIDPSSVADGIPSVVLNLVWTLILFFQVKEVTGRLRLSSSLSSWSCSSSSSSSDLSARPDDLSSTLQGDGRPALREPRYQGKAIQTLLQWVQRSTSKFGVEVQDFGPSWRSGLAFLAMIKSIKPALVDLRASLAREPRENLQLAFMIAHHRLDVPPLLEPRDVCGSSPDERSIITYVSMFLGCCSDQDQTMDIQVPEIPNVGSVESVSFGEILTDDPEAPALFRGSKSSEQLLWGRWARRSPEGPSGSSPPTRETTSPPKGKTSRPPSLLDAGVTSQEIRSWMDGASAAQDARRDEGRLSLSSEEGVYTLPVLDSDEEDAYSYILDLNKEDLVPTVEEMHLKGSPALPAGSAVDGKDQEEGSPDRRAGSDLEPEEHGGDGDRKMEDEGRDANTKLYEADCWNQHVQEQTEDTCGRDVEKEESSGSVKEAEKERATRAETKEELAGEDEGDEVRKSVDDEGGTVEEEDVQTKRRLADRKTTPAGQTAPKGGTDGGVDVHHPPPSAAALTTAREERVLLRPAAASPDMNPLELQLLLVLWFLVYCCFVLPQTAS